MILYNNDTIPTWFYWESPCYENLDNLTNITNMTVGFEHYVDFYLEPKKKPVIKVMDFYTKKELSNISLGLFKHPAKV